MAAQQRLAFPPAEKQDLDDVDECGVARKGDYCGAQSRGRLNGGGREGDGRVTRGVKLEDPFLPAPGVVTNARDLPTSIRLASYLPFGIFVLLVVAFTILYKSMPVLPWFATVLAADVVLVGAYPQRGGEGFHSRNRWDWFPLMCGLLALGSGVFAGIILSTIMEPVMHAHFLRTYTDVNPNSNPMMYSDGGVLHFASGTTLETGSSAGYLSWPYTYCAAPIVATGGAADAAVGFWAVGVNCCSANGEFTCDDAGDSTASSGLRVESHALGDATGHAVDNNYDLAVRKASAMYGKTIAASPVYVVWQKDPGQHATVSLIIALVVFVVLVGIAAGGCTATKWLLEKVSNKQQPTQIPGLRRGP